MNTAPLQTCAVLPANASNTAKLGDANAPTVPFHQMLSNEVAQRDRNHAGANNQTRRADTQAADKPIQTSDAKTANQASDETAPATAIKAKAADKPEASTVAGPAAPSTASATPISAELLALVAGVQAIQTSVTPAADGAAASDTIDSKLFVDADASAELLSGKTKLPLTADQTKGLTADAATGKAAIGADGVSPAATRAGDDAGFDSALKQIQRALGDGGAPNAKVLSASPESAANSAVSSLPASAAGAAFAPALQSTAQNLVADPGNKLMPQVGSQAWDAALGQKMVWMVAGAQQSATLTLNPPDLGPLQVVLHVNNSHANASFVSGQADVRQALEAALPRLREMLNDAGIQLGQASVGTDMPNQQQAQQQTSAGRSQPNSHGTDSSGHTSADALTPVARSNGKSSVARGMVDTFA